MDDLFLARDFAWTIRMRRDAPESFFDRQDTSGSLFQRRHHWLDTAPELCLASSKAGEPMVAEAWEQALQWGQIDDQSQRDLKGLGRQWEVDFILLDSATFSLAGGCVCFPSSWNLQESTGKTLAEVHGVVPHLTEQIGAKIDRFLQRLAPGQSFLRENWGLTRTHHLNHHPALNRPRLDATVSASEVFLRIEHQAFIRLPSGVLMGLRIEPVRLDRLMNQAPETAQRLHRQLSTMPQDVATYKSLSPEARARIVTLLA
ncbi:MAG: heme-dependent oxidative N-demethylase subunit alpha family protein [Verrucomicrobiota bacterium]